jgi:hypothetical protein
MTAPKTLRISVYEDDELMFYAETYHHLLAANSKIFARLPATVSEFRQQYSPYIVGFYEAFVSLCDLNGARTGAAYSDWWSNLDMKRVVMLYDHGKRFESDTFSKALVEAIDKLSDRRVHSAAIQPDLVQETDVRDLEGRPARLAGRRRRVGDSGRQAPVHVSQLRTEFEP